MRMSDKQPCVYMLASMRNGTIYLGVTSDLIKRVFEHRTNAVPGFSQRYGVHDLVWFEQHLDMADAIAREKQIKKWSRAAKLRLIEATNPAWRDLWLELV
jgi:putative endonuclease